MNTDVLIVGSGCSGLYCALKLPRDVRITLITKSDLESNDSYLAQGGMCMLKEQSDFDSFFEDTLKAGHYENDRESVGIMINSSPEVVKDLVSYGADFARNDDGSLAYTREGAHSHNRIIFHEDVTGKEITSTLLAQVKKLSNVTLMEYTTMVDIIERDNKCYGAIIRKQDGTLEKVTAAYTVMACGGVGGLYRFSTNFRHLTGDSLAIAKKHGIELKNPDYVQIHPTTFYTKKHEDRSFLISESVRGEGAKLLDKNMNRFVDELLPRDVLTGKIREQMKKDGTDFVWEDLRTIPRDELVSHFPRNRLASNSLLESLVFAKRAAGQMAELGFVNDEIAAKKAADSIDLADYSDEKAVEREYRKLAMEAIEGRTSVGIEETIESGIAYIQA